MRYRVRNPAFTVLQSPISSCRRYRVGFGFFSYQDDSNEVDIEFLSSDPVYYDTIHYTNQPGTVDGVVDSNAAKVITVSEDLT